MLHPLDHPHGLRVFRSALLDQLGLPHAFSTRRGGVSPAPFDSLNLGPACGPESVPGAGAGVLPGDTAGNVDRNYQRLQAALGCENWTLVRVRQVHGRGVAAAEELHREPRDADAVVTNQPLLLLTIRVADCVPILLADRAGKAVAAVHAGWRGVVAGVIPATLEAMYARYGTPSTDIIAAIGPCIGLPHFEIGPEVADAFTAAGLSTAIDSTLGPKPHIDLAAAVATQFRAAGVLESHIDRTDRCTYRDAADFFSHRRDNGRTGRMAAVIGLKS